MSSYEDTRRQFGGLVEDPFSYMQRHTDYCLTRTLLNAFDKGAHKFVLDIDRVVLWVSSGWTVVPGGPVVPGAPRLLSRVVSMMATRRSWKGGAT